MASNCMDVKVVERYVLEPTDLSKVAKVMTSHLFHGILETVIYEHFPTNNPKSKRDSSRVSNPCRVGSRMNVTGVGLDSFVVR